MSYEGHNNDYTKEMVTERLFKKCSEHFLKKKKTIGFISKPTVY